MRRNTKCDLESAQTWTGGPAFPLFLSLTRIPGWTIHMRANCGRTRRNGDPEIWDWVPAYVEHPRSGVTHTICPFCREYYYGAYLPGAGRR